MKLIPFILLYSATGKVVLSSVSSVAVSTIPAVNAAVSEINTNFATYGFGASPNYSQLPVIPDTAQGLFLTDEDGQCLHDGYSSGFTADDDSVALASDAFIAALSDATTALTPTISVAPASASVAAPGAHTFTVTAGGSNLSYQWQISTDSGTTWTNSANAGVYSGATTASLVISNSTGLTGKKYRVIVTNQSGSVTSAAATLTVT